MLVYGSYESSVIVIGQASLWYMIVDSIFESILRDPVNSIYGNYFLS